MECLSSLKPAIKKSKINKDYYQEKTMEKELTYFFISGTALRFYTFNIKLFKFLDTFYDFKGGAQILFGGLIEVVIF